MYHVTSHEAHADVVQMCFRYVSDLLKQKSCRDNIAESFPALSYVFSSGFNHIAHVDPGSMVVLEALQSFGSNVRHHPSHWDCLCELREENLRSSYPPWPSSRHDVALYLLIAYSSSGLLELFLSTYGPLKPRVGTNPLVYAADLRKTKHAMVLLACGADINMRGMVVDDSHKALPLDVAIDLADDVLVGELLQRGCVVSSQVLSTAVCMPWCSTRVLVKLMQTDEFVEWASDIGDEKLYRGVFNSARPNAGDSRKTDEDHVALARRLRQMGQELSADSPFGGELVERAVHAAHTSTLEYLLPPDQPPPPRFLIAASTGNTSETVSVVHFLLRRGVDINAVSSGRRDTPLHLATMCPWEPRSLELTQILVDAGCNPHVRNSRGETPLTIASKRGYLSVVEHLLSHNIPFPSDILPILLQQRTSHQTVELLIRKGADVHSIASNGDSVLHLAIAKYDEPACLDLIKSFIEAGCNPTTCNTGGKPILEVAIGRNYILVVEHLLSCSAPFPPDILLNLLERRTSPRIVELLIRKGVDVYCTASNGDTILHLAVTEYDESTCLDLVKSFIEAKCNPTTCNSEGTTVLEVAIECDYISVVEHLLSCNVPFPSDILPIALRNHSTPKMVEYLIRKGADVHSTASNGDTVLHLAVAKYDESPCLDLVKSFLGAGCNPTTHNFERTTILEVAIGRGYTSVVEHLLLCDVPFSPADILPSVLWIRSTPKTVEFLIRNGADVHSTAFNGDTVLHLTIANYPESTCLDLVESFVEAGCDPTTRNSRGKTVLEVAIGRGYTSVVEHLLSYTISFPHILPIALRNRATPRMIEFLILKGANVHSTASNGDTLLHLAIANYPESTCLDLASILIKAGCDPTVHDSRADTVLEAVMKRRYAMVTQYLILRNVPLPPTFHILSKALQQHCIPQIIILLARKRANDLAVMPESHWDTLVQLAHASYSKLDRQQIIGILNAGRTRQREHVCDETLIDVGGPGRPSLG